MNSAVMETCIRAIPFEILRVGGRNGKINKNMWEWSTKIVGWEIKICRRGREKN